jgi:hypothetical protein
MNEKKYDELEKEITWRDRYFSLVLDDLVKS